jgi:hypothetical protein
MLLLDQVQEWFGIHQVQNAIILLQNRFSMDMNFNELQLQFQYFAGAQGAVLEEKVQNVLASTTIPPYAENLSGIIHSRVKGLFSGMVCIFYLEQFLSILEFSSDPSPSTSTVISSTGSSSARETSGMQVQHFIST